jgi:uncharacterized protein YneF (UPF0154 family)
VTLHWTDLVVILAIVGSGAAAGYFLAMRTLRQTLLDRQRELERRVTMLAEAMRSMELQFGEQGPGSESAAADDAAREVNPAAGAVSRQEPGEIPPEMKVAIAAAAVAVLGPGARIHSARAVRPEEVVSPWSQQGRVSVQASHNLRVRR